MEDAELAEIAKALGSETRAALVRALSRHPLCVNALAERLSVSPSAVSQHLKALRSAGLVSARRRGYFVHYSLCPDALRRLADELTALAEGPESYGRCCLHGEAPGPDDSNGGERNA